MVLTSLDVMFILMGWNDKHYRKFEFFIFSLVALTTLCILIIVFKSDVVWSQVFFGFVPQPHLFINPQWIYAAVGIVGATVMPHSLYLHSSIVQARSSVVFRQALRNSIVQPDSAVRASFVQPESVVRRNSFVEEPQEIDETSSLLSASSTESLPRLMPRPSLIPKVITMSILDTVIALFFAVLTNCSILIVSAANFNSHGMTDVADIGDAFQLISKQLGTFAGVLFAIALLSAGQSSTITGTITGQIIMEGFLGSSFQVPPWLRRIITRLLAIVPALMAIFIYGEQYLNDLLIISQVVLSFQLPFAVWPLVYFTSNRDIMNDGCIFC